MGLEPSPVKNLAIQEVIREANVEGPVEDLAEKVKQLHLRKNNQE